MRVLFLHAHRGARGVWPVYIESSSRTISEAPEGVRAWTKSLYEVVDSKDANAFGQMLAEDASLHFANQPPVHGRAEIVASIAGFFSSIAALKHHFERVWHDARGENGDGGSTVVCEGRVTYTRHSGSELNVPFVVILGLKNERVHDYRIYVDISTLYAE